MPRPIPIHARARPLTALTLALAAALAACDGDSTAPQPPPEISVAFLDNAQRLNTVRSGGEPALTGLKGIVPIAAAGGKLAFFAPRVVETSSGHSVVVDSGGLRLYHIADGRVDTLPVPRTSANTPGAISPDGKTIVYARVASDSVWLVSIRLDSTGRDSANLSAHVEDSPAAEESAVEARP